MKHPSASWIFRVSSVYHELWMATSRIVAHFPLPHLHDHENGQDYSDVKIGFYSKGFSSLTQTFEREYLENKDAEWESDGEQDSRATPPSDESPLRPEVQYNGYAADKNAELSGLPRWLLTCKAILNEGLEQFRLKAQH